MEVLAHRSVFAAVVLYSTLKGLLIASVALAFTSNFSDALAIAIVSGTLGVIGMVLAAWVSSRAYHSQMAPTMSDVKRKLGLAQRATDAELEAQEQQQQQKES